MSRRVYLFRPGHPKANERGFVSADDVGDWQEVTPNAPLFTDRYLEGTRAVDGTDIGSRAKRVAYMKRHGVTDSRDFTNYGPEVAKQKASDDRRESAARRDLIARQVYKKFGA